MGGVNSAGLNIFAGDSLLSDINTTGRVYWVGNGSTYVPGGVAGADVSGAHGNSPQRPFATIDYAVGQCTANRGDVIVVLPGHVEAVAAVAGLDLDVAGIRILFLGEGSNRATIRFGTVVGADMDVDAADITLGMKGKDYGPRFLANIDALTGPIDINSARFKMYGAKWYDGTTINTTDCVVGDASADNVEIEDFEFVDGDAAGTQKQSFIQFAAATGVILRKIKCTGDFGTGIIENGTAWVDALLEDLVLDNASASPTVAIFLSATSSGWVRNSSLRVASGLVGYTANNDMQFDNVRIVGTDALGAADDVIGSTATTAATGAVTTTDTVMGYIKQIVTMLGPTELDADTLGEILVGTAGISTFPAAAIPGDTVSLAEVIRQLYAALEGTAASQDGVATWPTAAAYANNVSIAEVLGYVQDAVRRGTGTTLPANTSLADYAEAVITTAAAVIAAGTATIFTIAGGPIEVVELLSVCISSNDGTATLLKYTADPTDGAATDLTIASASLASATLGTTALVTGTFGSAPTISANGVVAGGTTKFIVTVGVIQTITTGGVTTGTWTHHLRYKPLSKGVTVS